MDTEREQLKEYRFVYEALDDKKGLDIMGIYLGEASYIADIFILVTANSDIHMNTLRDTAMEALKSRGIQSTVEGRESLQWCLVDGGNVAIHIFSKTGRDHYRLEKLWGDAPMYQYSSRK